MDYRRKLFASRHLYNPEQTNPLFVEAMKRSIEFHHINCPEYAQILDSRGFNSSDLNHAADLHLIPPIPTLFYKSHELHSVPESKMVIMSTSSGTKGVPTRVGLDAGTCYYGALMLKRTLSYHKLFSFIPANYLIMGYQPSKHNKMGAVKTAFGGTFLAPPLHREYALKDNGTGYDLNPEGVKRCLLKWSRSGIPVRILGFPAYLYFMMNLLKENNVRLTLSPRSMIILGGGWKQFAADKVDKRELYQMAEETLGIKEDNIREIFGVVESNVLYCGCSNHHFHVPVYGHVIIRDPITFEPVPDGTPGLLNLLSPLVGSMPVGSIVTDDIAILHDGRECGCGIKSPYFEVLGRTGMTEIKTCAANADDVLGEVRL